MTQASLRGFRLSNATNIVNKNAHEPRVADLVVPNRNTAWFRQKKNTTNFLTKIIQWDNFILLLKNY